jgi:hypothetical protein
VSDGDDWRLGPVNPLRLDVEKLRTRVHLLFEVEKLTRGMGFGELLLPGERPLEAVDFRCWLCRRVFQRGWTDAEALAEFASRCPDEEMEPGKFFCGDCMTVMDAWAQANPEEWR